MKELIDRFFKNWKSTMVAVVLGVCLFILYKKQMTATDFIMVMGGVSALYLALKKDNDL